MNDSSVIKEWENRADEFCRAWSSEVGRPNFEALSQLYAADSDVVIYDTLPPLAGFRGFEEMRQQIYPELCRIEVRRTGALLLKSLCEGRVVVTAYPFHLSYGFTDGQRYEIDARITETWEQRPEGYRIVQEHPSTVWQLENA